MNMVYIGVISNYIPIAIASRLAHHWVSVNTFVLPSRTYTVLTLYDLKNSYILLTLFIAIATALLCLVSCFLQISNNRETHNNGIGPSDNAVAFSILVGGKWTSRKRRKRKTETAVH